MNRLRKILRLSSQAAGAVCLGLGFAFAGQWVFVAPALVIFVGGILDLKWPSSWLPPLALATSTGLAVIGVFTGATVSLMLLAATLALTTWDLALLDHALARNPADGSTNRLEKRHYQSLAVVLGVGLLALLANQVIIFQIPFVVMLALVAVVLYLLMRLWRMLND